jgi:hypothetical protein
VTAGVGVGWLVTHPSAPCCGLVNNETMWERPKGRPFASALLRAEPPRLLAEAREELMVAVGQSKAAPGAARKAPTPGARVAVRAGKGRREARVGTVVDVHAFEAVSRGWVIVVRWDDDGSTSRLVPDAGIEVIVA